VTASGGTLEAPRARRGQWAEDVAREYLQARGLRTVARNYRGRRGEIDLVMRARDVLVFVEVRYRARSDYGTGADTVDRVKRAKLVATAQQFLQRYAGAHEQACRFDVVAVSGQRNAPRVEWIADAFEEDL